MTKRAWFLLFFVGLFFTYVNIPLKEIDPELAPYYQEFLGLYNEFCPNRPLPTKTVIKFNFKGGTVIGTCTRSYKRSVIEIDPINWYLSPLMDRKQLMFHELTHCLLSLGHVDERFVDNYMNPVLYPLEEPSLSLQVINNMHYVCDK